MVLSPKLLGRDCISAAVGANHFSPAKWGPAADVLFGAIVQTDKPSGMAWFVVVWFVARERPP
jgi:hypothetical protein